MSAKKLSGYFKGASQALVAFSGGVDSSVLSKAAYDALGDGALAVTLDTPAVPRREIRAARKTAKAIGIRHLVVKFDPFAGRKLMRNPPDRCYLCKRAIAGKLKSIAKERGIALLVEGTNAGDLLGHRPGFRAVREAGIRSPLAELGFDKPSVRRLAKKYGLDYGKPSGACMATRLPSGALIEPGIIGRIERSEDYLKSLGLSQVRVRVGGPGLNEARIEVYPRERGMVLERAEEIAAALPFGRVCLDLRGYS
jgi:pyridinium-3,5-biscarboxylic acid mononucleotide sulfurtransferase